MPKQYFRSFEEDSKNKQLLQKVQSVVGKYGAKAVEIGSVDAVNVMGDYRFVGPPVYVCFPADMDMEEIGRVATEVVNNVHGVTRVLVIVADR